MTIPKPTQPRSLLKRTIGLATLVCVGVAETACNLQVVPYQDTGPRPVDAGHDTGAPGHDAGAPDATTP